MAALTDVSPTSEITLALALVLDMGSYDYLLNKTMLVLSTINDEVVEVHTPGEVLLALRECVLALYRHGAWGVTHALAAMTTSGE